MTPRAYALTYPQLMSQAIAQGLSETELARLRAAYGLAERMADGLYRGQGVPFINHLVRTASIVLAQRQPVEVVIASMTHAAYMLHAFERSRRKPGGRWHQAQVEQRIGSDVESLIQAYDELPWRSEGAIERHRDLADTYPASTRSLLIIRLANELEDYLDLGMAYRGRRPFRTEIEVCGRHMVELARRLDLSQLAGELQAAFEEHLEHALPDAVVRDHRNAYELPRRHWGEMNAVERTSARLQRWIGRYLSMGKHGGRR